MTVTNIAGEFISEPFRAQVAEPSKAKDFVCDGFKQDYATLFDQELKEHVNHHLKKLRAAERKASHDRLAINLMVASPEGDPGSTILEFQRTVHPPDKKPDLDESLFVHLFGVPLFRLVASNWARLIVRRSFDLDLLEWRPKQSVTSRTINEIKSRCISIARHQRDLNSSVEILRALELEEQGQKVSRNELTADQHGEKATHVLALSEQESGWNRGRVNGLVTEAPPKDTWERMYWDFFELKHQMDALDSRANKIQDGSRGLSKSRRVNTRVS